VIVKSVRSFEFSYLLVVWLPNWKRWLRLVSVNSPEANACAQEFQLAFIFPQGQRGENRALDVFWVFFPTTLDVDG
jgi:hypothetical protein